MGIYIPDIEIPKGHNYVTITIWSSGAASSVLFDREGVLREFKDFKELKAVPVPEHKKIKAVPVPPHGRLGDLDELYAHLNEWYLTNNPVFTKEEALYVRAMLLGIVEAPTIIPAEEGDT